MSEEKKPGILARLKALLSEVEEVEAQAPAAEAIAEPQENLAPAVDLDAARKALEEAGFKIAGPEEDLEEPEVEEEKVTAQEEVLELVAKLEAEVNALKLKKAGAPSGGGAAPAQNRQPAAKPANPRRAKAYDGLASAIKDWASRNS